MKSLTRSFLRSGCIRGSFLHRTCLISPSRFRYHPADLFLSSSSPSQLGELILADLTRPASSPHYSLHPLRSGSISTLRISGSQPNLNDEAEALMLSSKHYDDNDMPRSPPLGGAEERTSESTLR